MAGFASLLGGAGHAVQQYGQQMRPILEQRREALGNFFSQQAQAETDPNMRSQWLQSASDALSGKDWGKILPPLIKAKDTHTANTAAIGQAAQQVLGTKQPAPPAPPGFGSGLPGGPGMLAIKPSPLPEAASPLGITMPEGTPFANAIGQPMDQGAAAQPDTNPLTSAGGAIQAPTAAASPQSNIPTPQDVYKQFTALPEFQTPAGRQFLQPFVTQELTHNEGLRQAEALRRMDLTERQTAVTELQKSPEWAQVPDIMKAQYRLWAHSQSAPLPQMAASLMRPYSAPGSVLASSVPDAERVDLDGNVIDAKQFPYVREHTNLLTGARYYTSTLGPMATFGDAQGNIIRAPFQPGVQTGAVPLAQLNPRLTGVNPETGANVYGRGVDLVGPQAPNAVSHYIGVNPTFVPRTTTSLRSINTTDENGNSSTLLQPVSTFSQRGHVTAPGAPSVPALPGTGPGPDLTGKPPSGKAPGVALSGAGMSFPKPFTPEQKTKMESQVNQYDIAIDRMKNVKDKLYLLDSMIDSGKLSLEMNTPGILRMIPNRIMPMTKAETDFIGDMQTLTEDINLIRGPMGATSFRGPEAFEALQSQRGQLLANPDITRRVLANTLTSMQAQRGTLYNAIHPPAKSTKAPAGGGGAVDPNDPEGLKAYIRDHPPGGKK